KKLFVIVIIAALVSCGSKQEGNQDLAGKKAALETLTKQRDELNNQINVLQTEINKMAGGAVTEKLKLVEATALVTQDFSHYIELQGKVSTENVSYVTPRGMGGQVKQMYVKQGDVVRKGQLLMKLEDGIVQQNIKQVESQLSFAKNIFNRQENLWNEGIGTEVQFLSAKNNVESLEKQLGLVKEQLSTTLVTAEVSGVIETVGIKVGETFIGNPMATIVIVNPGNLKAVVDVPENYISKVKKGMPAIISIPDLNESFNSQISVVSETINVTSRSFVAESKLPSRSNVKPNQVALIKLLDHQAKNAIVVPVETVQTDEKGKYVYVMAEENGKKIARKRSITIGEFYDELIEVKSGLAVNDQLITKGFQGLYEGQLLTLATK
ncbi:MAG: efflux RND transporter periplasmic adaptor subunit, partial [Chitinophagaceae bacterium]